MQSLLQPIRIARRRLFWQRFADVIGETFFGVLTVAFLLIVAGRIVPLGIDASMLTLAAVVIAFLMTVVKTFWRRPTLLAAAVELDRRFDLKERISSALALTPDDQNTAVGGALLADAASRAAKLHVAERFRVTPSHGLLLPLAPALATALVVLFFNPAVAEKIAAAKTDVAVEPIQKAAEAMHRQAAEQREKAKKENLQDAEKLFTKIEKETRELKSEQSKPKALAKLNDLAKTLADRRKELAGAESVKRQLEQLQNIPRGPADPLAKAMAQSDFSKAIKELKELEAKLQHGQLDAKQKAAMAEQIERMKEKLEKAQKTQEKAEKELERQIQERLRTGDKAEAKRLQEKLDQMKKQSPQMQQMRQLADRLGQCSKCLREGKNADVASALEKMQSDMKDLQDQTQGQLDEMDMLDNAQEQLAQAKNCMTGDKGGDKCLCDTPGVGEDRGTQAGNGIGTSHGVNFRRGQRIDAKHYDSQVKQRAGGGATMVDLVDGPNVKGRVQQEIQQQVESTERGETDPLTNRHMPRKHGENAREYFDDLRTKDE